MKRPAEGGGEVEGWPSCCGRPPSRAQGCGRLARETAMARSDQTQIASACLLGWRAFPQGIFKDSAADIVRCLLRRLAGLLRTLSNYLLLPVLYYPLGNRLPG